ncbi:HEAT repeat-containing PBS lyase, partial [Thauera phenylacetica B4P]
MNNEIEHLVATIDAHPEPLHADYTAEVRALVRIGLPALPAVLPLLMAEAELTRLRAQRVLEGVTRAWAAEHAAAAPQRAWEALWQAHGAYDWRAPAA